MSISQLIRCNGCTAEDELHEIAGGVRERLKNYWIVAVRSKWNGDLLDFCPQCKAAGKHLEHIVEGNRFI